MMGGFPSRLVWDFLRGIMWKQPGCPIEEQTLSKLEKEVLDLDILELVT